MYPLLFGLIRLLSYCPLRVLYVLSDVVLYPLVHYVIHYRRAVVRQNLHNSFPELSDEERRRIERRFYHYFCDLIVEIVKGVTMSPAEYKRRMHFVGLEAVEETLVKQDFCLCFLGHFGNWEWLTGLPLFLRQSGMTQIYHPMRNKSFDRWFCANRSRFGAINIPMKQTLRRLMTLRADLKSGKSDVQGYLLGCIADQLPKAENVHHHVTFLNQRTAVFTGSEKIGVMLDASFCYVHVRRPRRGYYEIEFEVMTTTPKEEPEFALTDEYMRRFEADIRQQPELWLWTHKRWKR